MKSRFLFRAYIFRVSLFAALIMFAITFVFVSISMLVFLYNDRAYVDYVGLYALGPIFAGIVLGLETALVSGTIGGMSSILVSLLIHIFGDAPDRKPRLFRASTIATIFFSLIFSFMSWSYPITFYIIIPNTSTGWIRLLALPTSFSIIIAHYFAFPHIFAEPRKRKSKAEN